LAKEKVGKKAVGSWQRNNWQNPVGGNVIKWYKIIVNFILPIANLRLEVLYI